MNVFIIIAGLFITIISAVMGPYVLFKNPRSHIFQAFALIAFGIFGWNLTIFLLLSQVGPAIVPGRLAFSFVTLIAVGLAIFVSLFPTPMRHYRPWIVLNSLLGAFAFSIPLWPSYLSFIKIVDGHITGDLNMTLFGWWTLHYTPLLILTFILLIIRSFYARGVNRLRLRQLVWGFGLFLVPMLMTQILLPMFFGDFRWNNLGPLFTIFLIAFMANAILQYRILDMKWIFGKSVALTAVGTVVLWVLATIYMFVAGLISQDYAFILVALFIALSFEPIVHNINKLVNRIVNHGSYDPQIAMKELVDVVRGYTNVDQILEMLLSKFSTYFSTEEIGIVLFKYGSLQVIDQRIKGFSPSIKQQVAELANVARQSRFEILEIGELEWRKQFETKRLPKESKWLDTMYVTGVQQLIPFTVDGRLVGLLMFGKRRFDKSLRSRDITFLNLARFAISPALENASKFAAIEELNEQLIKADKSKSEFVDVVSHRFRTPLSAIRWNLETTLEANLKIKKEHREALADSHNRTLFLITTLDKILSVLDLESDKLKLTFSNFDLKEAFKDLLNQTSADAKNREIKLKIVMDPITISADKRNLLIVIESLLSNALLYTGRGGTVTFIVKRDGNNAIISVSDTGIGIPAKELDRVFEKFYRSKNGILSYTDGQGLGLYISQKIVNLHHGTISVASELGKGTTFTVKLPLRRKSK